MNKELLLRGAAFLETIPDLERKDMQSIYYQHFSKQEKSIFHMGRWANLTIGLMDEPVYESNRNRGVKIREFQGTFDCGFAGCAMGWFVHAKVFEGLTFNYDGYPRYGGEVGYEAAMRLFNIGHDRAQYLFSPDLNWEFTPKQVAEKMRDLAETGEMRTYTYWLKRFNPDAAVQETESKGTEGNLDEGRSSN